MSPLRARWLPVLAVAGLLVAFAGDRLTALDQPLDTDALTQRALIATLPPEDLLAGRYRDTRHPPLGFLVLAPFARASLEAWVLRLPAALASLGGMAALAWLGARVVGPWRALAPVLLLGLSLPWLAESRTVSDLPLVVLLALLSARLLLDALERPHPARLLALTTCAAATAWASWTAPVLLLALAVAAIAGRPAAPWRLAGAALGVGLAVAPLVPRALRLLGDDARVRALAAADPSRVWGDRDATGLLAEAGELVAPDPVALAVTCALGLLGLVRLARAGKRAEAVLLGVAVALPPTLAALGVGMVRLQPYYLLVILPFALLAATAGALGVPGEPPLPRPVRAVTALALLAVLVPAGRTYAAGLARTMHPRVRMDFRAVGEAIRQGPPARVIGGPHHLTTALVLYATDDPAAVYRTCRVAPEGGWACGDNVVTLVLASRLPPGWQQDALRRFRALRDRDAWVVETDVFPDEVMHAELVATCEPRLDTPELHLWWCPADAQDGRQSRGSAP